VAIKSLKPEVKVIGVQAEGAANAVQSFLEGRRTEAGAVNTIADGIKVQQVGERCFDVIQKYVDEMITVSDVEIARAMLLLDEHAHLSAEPAGAVPVAAFLSGKLPAFGGPAMAVISGGNIDTFEKTRYIRRALAEEERHLRINVRLVDRRGSKPRQMSHLSRRRHRSAEKTDSHGPSLRCRGTDALSLVPALLRACGYAMTPVPTWGCPARPASTCGGGRRDRR
jgi:threonine dehydratase